jgi:predicted GIY-YIG superfamily endonuclease
MKIGFSPRKANLSLYIGIGSADQADALKKLGKHKTGKGCLYINKLEDVDLKVLKELIDTAVKNNKG